MNIIIQEESKKDITAISLIVKDAFDNSEAEPMLVSLIRERDQALISLIALDDKKIVGHVMVSPITLMPPNNGAFGGVAPLSVSPDQQNKGIGSKLMHATITACRSRSMDALFLLGNPTYYSRFGFVTSHIGNDYGATDSFMHLELNPQCLHGLAAKAAYVSAFGEVGA